MRDQVRQMIESARRQPGSSLGAEAVRAARIAAALHAAQSAEQPAAMTAENTTAATQAHFVLQEQWR